MRIYPANNTDKTTKNKHSHEYRSKQHELYTKRVIKPQELEA